MPKSPSLIEALKQAPNIWSEEIIVNRHEFITSVGTVERHIYWIEQGAVRAFRISEHEEQTIRFGYQHSLITALPSFYGGIPSSIYLQAIRKCHLRKASKTDFDAFISASKERLLQYQEMLEMLFVQQMEREIDLLTHSPVERYQRVLARSPQLFQEVPAKYIASYLRMQPETLSRIRKDS